MDPSWPLIETFGETHPSPTPRDAELDDRLTMPPWVVIRR
jgi:hypothetical protein